MAPPRRRSRSTLDFRGSQAGDVTTGDSAGGDIHHNDPAAWLEFIKGQLWRAEEARDIRHGELLDRMDRQEDALKLHEIAEEQRRKAEDESRKERQALLDADLAAIRAEQQRLRLASQAMRWWFLGLACLIVFAFGIIALLLYERYAAAALIRYWLGAGLGLAAALARVRP